MEAKTKNTDSSKQGFTKGNWEKATQWQNCDGQPIYSKARGKREPIAWVNYTQDNAEMVANASLICAAPLLLEALQRFVKFADKVILESADKYESAMVLQAKAAIKAATT